MYEFTPGVVWTGNMLDSINGSIKVINSTSVVMELGPVAVSVLVPEYDLKVLIDGNTSVELGFIELRCRLYTCMRVSNEMPILYGFASRESRDLFVQLQGVSGVGVRQAFLMLSALGADGVRQAIRDSDVATLRTAKGIGYKTARRITDILGDALREG